MPYAITVLFLVLIATGYTLFQQQAPIEPVTTETPSQELQATSDETSSAPPYNDEAREATKEHDAPDEIQDSYDDNPSVSGIQEQAVAATSATAPTTPTVNTTYTDGSYRTQSSFRTPDGTYQMDVTVQVKDDTITTTSLSFDADGARDGYSKRFLSAYQTQVIGKDLRTTSLSRVGGASLTTKAFNSALNTIRSQAS